MQSVEIQGLDKVKKALEAAPEAIREARAQVFDEMGEELLGVVQRRIGGSGRVAGVQEYQVGSGKGYVAVRAKAKTDLDGYCPPVISPMRLKTATPCEHPPEAPNENGNREQTCAVYRASTCTTTRQRTRCSTWQRPPRSALRTRR